VMYAGGVVEDGPTAEVMADPRHPYTRGLLHALPDRAAARGQLEAIQGSVPDLTRLPEGCAFAARCPLAREACRNRPPMVATDPAGLHHAACWAVQEEVRPS